VAAVYSDYDVAYDTALTLRSFGHHVVTTRDMGQDEATDDRQLLTAATNGWVLVTHNRDDFVLLHRAWHSWTAAWSILVAHSGILVLPQQRWNAVEQAEVLDRFLRSHESLLNEAYVCDRTERWLAIPPV
jgi:hypothetical protein